MKDDTPTAKSIPAEPTPAAGTRMSEGNMNSGNATTAAAAAAIDIAIGRPTPSPDQLLHPTTASSIKSYCSSPTANDGVVIGGNAADDATPATSSPDTIIEQQSSSSSLERSDSISPDSNGNVVIGGKKSINDTPNGKQIDNAKAASAAEEDIDKDPYITTPSPYKKQSTSLDNDDKAMHDFNVAGVALQQNINSTGITTPPDCRLSTPTDPNNAIFGSNAMLAASSSFYQEFPISVIARGGRLGSGNGIFSKSLIETPDGYSLFRDCSNVSDFDVIGREILAAASTTSMLSRYDGFEAGMSMPAYVDAGETGMNGMYRGSDIAMTTSGCSLDANQMAPLQLQPEPQGMGGGMDMFASLPPYEFPRRKDNEQTGSANAVRHGGTNNFYQMYVPASNGSDITTNGERIQTPTAVAAAASYSYTTEHISTMVPPVDLSDSKKTGSANVTKKLARLPLRKRKLQVDYNDAGSGDTVAAVAVAVAPIAATDKGQAYKRPARHNERKLDRGERITCACAKSKCLKLYCDCFQRGKICINDCECKGCQNTKENSGPNGIRTTAIRAVIERRGLEAFQPRTKDTEDGCNCKKSRCLKKFCTCFGAGMKCDSRCRCKNCGNRDSVHPVAEVAVPNMLSPLDVASEASQNPKPLSRLANGNTSGLLVKTGSVPGRAITVGAEGDDDTKERSSLQPGQFQQPSSSQHTDLTSREPTAPRPVLLLSEAAPSLPDGWIRKTYKRASGTTAGTTDKYFYTPQENIRFRTMKSCRTFLQLLGEPGINGENDAFKVYKERGYKI